MHEGSPEGASGPDLQSRSLESLDWPRLLAHLQERAQTSLGRERCLGLCAHPTLAGARGAQQETAEMMALVVDEVVPLGGLTDARPLLGRAARGDVLAGRELTEVAANAGSLLRLRRYLLSRAEKATRLAAMAEALPQLSPLVDLLQGSFDTRGELSQAMYPQLADLRAAKARLHAEIARRIEELVKTESWTGVLQDDFTTVRNDRYVVPVRAQARNLDLGIVHDTSSSGHTVYVEPKEVLGLNNRLVMADAELRHEERRILTRLSQQVGQVATELEAGLLLGAELDHIHARARLGLDLGAHTPELLAAPRVQVRDARHPLLALRGLGVVGNDLSLGSPHLALILTGPNTGGKTVALKTLGLMALMARCGLPLPAAPGARIGVFPRVLTDIGDTQDIEADLSTFSGHLGTVRRIFEALDDAPGSGTLVLLDEIAVGTDPRQGAALGRAILQDLLDRGCLLATTTHYTELKALAATDSRFVNGRMEYDAENLRPTYRLTLGHPGRSYALEIARRLGLPARIVDAAEGWVEAQERELEALLQEQEREAARARAEAERARATRLQAEAELRDLERVEAELEERGRRLKAEVAQRFRDEVRGYREQVRDVIAALQKSPGLAQAERTRRRIEDGAAAVQQALEAELRPGARPGGERLDWANLRVGDEVYAATLSRVVQLGSLPDSTGKVEIRAGTVRLRVPVQDLGPRPAAVGPGPVPLASAKAPVPAPGRRTLPVSGTGDDLDGAFRSASNTVDVRGLRVDEALDKVERYLDEAVLAGKEAVFVLHGHGTNAIRDALRRALKESPYCRKFAAAREEQGGDAVTAVALR